MFKTGEVDSLWGCTLLKIRIISKNASNEESHAYRGEEERERERVRECERAREREREKVKSYKNIFSYKVHTQR